MVMLTLSCLCIYTGWMCFICVFLPVMYFWMLLLTILCSVACFIVLRLLFFFHVAFRWSVFVACLDLTWGRFIDRSIDWLIDRLLGDLLFRSVIVFDFAPYVQERCDPCEFLLALRGFVELISVMVRFRSSVLCRLRSPRCDWKLPRLGPWARSRTSKGIPPQPEFLKPNTVQKTSFL